jgi:flagellar protein FlgJ
MIVTSTPAAAATPVAKPELKAAAQRFEAVFLREMIATMRKAKLADDIVGSSATDSFREMADARTADALAKQGAFGIAGLVERQLDAKK